MAILKTTYGSTGSVSYEKAESVLHLGGRKIRIYGDSEDGIHERELSPRDRVEIIDGNAVIHAEGCPDAVVNEPRPNPDYAEWKKTAQQRIYEEIAPKEQKQAGANIDRHLQGLYHQLFVLQLEAQKNLNDRCAPSSERKTKRLDYNCKIRLKTDEISNYLGDC